jgi:ComEC/Rec2-related protein
MLALGLPQEDEPLRLLWAMTLGWKTALSGEVSEPFMRSGTMHIFAISGLHIALIAGILVSLLRVMRCPRQICGLLVIPSLWLYTAATGWQASAIRSTIMMSVIICGWALHRPSDLLNSLAAAGLIILVWDPQQLFQASFQLSFSVVLSLALFMPVLEAIRRRLTQADPLLPEELWPRWRRWLGRPLQYVSTGVTTSLAAWLGSIPLVACYFHLFTPVSLLANLLVVPLSSAALASNLATLVIGPWLSPAAELFNHSAWFLMKLMVEISVWASSVPGGAFHTASPRPLGLMLYYALLLSLMSGWLARARLRPWLLGGLAALALGWVVDRLHYRAATRLTILPLNGGSAIYFNAPGRTRDWLLDCGNQMAAELVTKPFLQALGVNRLPRLLLSHGDLRHVGGTELIVETFAVEKVCFSPARFRSQVYRELQQKFQNAQGQSPLLERGQKFDAWTVLHPDRSDRFPQADDNALVLAGEWHGVRLLLLSDLGQAGQNVLLQRHPQLRADMVISGLPGQAEPLADGLLDALRAKMILITDADYPATERASPALRERLARRNAPVIYTRESGTVTIELRPGRWWLQSGNGVKINGP